MGADIHTLVQEQIGDDWVASDIQFEPYIRNYEFFGQLAGIRGALPDDEEDSCGIDGLPQDFSLEECRKYHPNWFPEHTIGHCTGEDIATYKWNFDEICYTNENVLNEITDAYEQGRQIRLIYGFDS